VDGFGHPKTAKQTALRLPHVDALLGLVLNLTVGDFAMGTQPIRTAELAWLYDRHWSAHYDPWAAEVLSRTLLQDAPPVSPIPDLCCGNGILAGELSNPGYQAVGLDIWSQLLAYAPDHYLAQHKSRLFSDLSGTVLEIGPGVGANLRRLSAKRVRWIGVEPNPYLNHYLAAEARRLGMSIELRPGTAEQLPVESNTVDFAISTLVLCSVVDQRAAINEILRVLKRGGRFVFIEHVAAPGGSFLRWLQTAIKPLWRSMSDGCTPDRQTRRELEKSAFAVLEVEEFSAPLPIVGPHIAGFAIKG
jgi:ubiquinone/menaquinone biosynthesis C-methylase UbiE